jgi:hypothetical protein
MDNMESVHLDNGNGTVLMLDNVIMDIINGVVPPIRTKIDDIVKSK